MDELSDKQREAARETYERRASLALAEPCGVVIESANKVVDLEKKHEAMLEMGKAMQSEIDRRMSEGDRLMADALEVSMSEIRQAVDEGAAAVGKEREVLRLALAALRASS